MKRILLFICLLANLGLGMYGQEYSKPDSSTSRSGGDTELTSKTISPRLGESQIDNIASQNQNYIITVIPLIGTTTIKYNRNGLPRGDDGTLIPAVTTIQYFDGLGRLGQIIERGITPSGADLLYLQEYDSFGRESKTWLPGVVDDNSGLFVDLTTAQNSSKASNLNDSHPYTEIRYEPSPLNRVLDQYGPGADWYSKGSSIRTEYLANPAAPALLSCILFRADGSGDNVILTKGGNYPANELFITKTTDEGDADGNRSDSYEYKDKFGRVILTRQIKGTEKLDTYYVYDDFGNLCYVIPPILTDLLQGGISTQDVGLEMKQYAYVYKYDKRNRCVKKKLPGTDWIYYYYDKANRLILTQDGEQRKTNQYTFNIPDVFGRVVLSGICGNSIDKLNYFENVIVTATYDQKNDTYKGYTISNFTPSNNSSLLTVNYYDNYNHIGKAGFITMSYDPQSGYGVKYDTPKGQLTGSAVAVLGTKDFLYCSLFYDSKGRLIQSKTTNHMGGDDREYIAYNFSGQPIKKYHRHQVSGKPVQEEFYTYTYDRAGRLIDTKHKLNNNSEILLSKNEYDDLGRLKTNKKNNHTSLVTNYAYNIRSWITKMNSNHLIQGLTYHPNGNVETFTWRSNNQSRTYAYTYDHLSRLTKASYTGDGQYSTSYSYDKHGNMLSLDRYGKKDNGTSASSFGLVDQLTLKYTGNQLKSITDAAPNIIISESADFKDNVNKEVEYTFNNNGAMMQDLNKGISSIQYNILNLPQAIEIANPQTKGRIKYTYTATGVKLKVIYETDPGLRNMPLMGTATFASSGSETKTTDYLGNKVYENGSLKRILVDGGYIVDGKYFFYLTDHLGNNRIVTDADAKVKQRTHYYPFGSAFADSYDDGGNQPYKYNGKELDRMHQLNMYDYSARYLEPALGRFISMDPLAEKYYSWSPYIYVGNNPILNIDPDGRDYWSTNDQDLIKQFLNSMGGGSNVHDMSGWNHAADTEFLGRGTFNDETGKFYTSYASYENGIATVTGVTLDTNIKPGVTSEGMGYPGAFVYSYNEDFPSFLGSNFGGRLYTDAYNLVQRGIFSSIYADEYAFDPTYYDDGTTGWAVNTAGRIIGEYEESDMPFIPLGGGKGGPLGFKAHRKGKNWQKHSAPRAGGDPASGRYGQSRNKNRGDSNKKYIAPKNPNKRK